MKKVLLLTLLVIIITPSLALAKIGVGVGTGKIYMEGELKPGGIYTVLESAEKQEDGAAEVTMTVINTGDEASDYEMMITNLANQSEKWPDEEWFVFEPEQFFLDPGKVQPVNVKINLPIKAEPGDYFVFLEARPAKKGESGGGAKIGVAAATKLWFTVAPSNVFSAIYYRALALFRDYKPWSQIILALVVVATLFVIIKHNFSFQLSVGKKQSDTDKKEKEEDSKESEEEKQ